MKYVGVKTTGELRLHEVKEPQTDEVYMAVEDDKLGAVPIRPYEFVKWDGKQWVKVFNVELMTTLGGNNITAGIAPEFEKDKTYNIGSVVEHNGSLYINYYGTITDSEWVPEHWTQTSIAELLSAIVKPQNVEKPKLNAAIGDAVYADALGNVHFIAGETVVAGGIPSGWEFVGVVALRKANKATILHKNENTSIAWAKCWLFRVEGLAFPLTSAVSMVMQQGPATGSTPVEVGTYTSSEGVTSLDDFVIDLDTWLQANPTASGALSNYGWHASKMKDADGNDACFIVVDKIDFQSRFSPVKSSTSGATASLYMWQWCGFDVDVSSVKRKDGVNTYAVVWNKDRFKAYNTNVNNPTDSLTTAGLFSEAGFNATTTVKAFYGTYDNYLDNMAPDKSATTGAYSEFDGLGEETSNKLAEVKYTPISGTETNVFGAVDYAKSQKAHSTANVEGLNTGDFYIPSIDDIYEIFSVMKTDGSDPVNATLVRALGPGNERPLSVARWVPARDRNYTTWILYSSGNFSTTTMYTNLRVDAVALYDLDD